MNPRIAIAGFVHETNTYVSQPTTIADFEVLRREEICRHFGRTSSTVGGMLAAARELGASVVPLVHVAAQPSGTIEAAAYEQLRGEILAAIERASAVDVVALDLHGAGVAAGIDDLEGDLCRRAREMLPREVCLVATLDLHGNLTQSMAQELTLALGCHEYPHLDFFDRGREVIRLAIDVRTHRLEPHIHVERLPLLLGAGPQTCTLGDGPAVTVNNICRSLEERPGILDCTFFHGFAPADVPFAGAAIVVTDANDAGAAKAVAQEAAARLWELRDQFHPPMLGPRDAVEQALVVADMTGGPVVISDTADNPGGGAPGDGTHLLRALLDAGAKDACLGALYDPATVEAAVAAGPGATIRASLGGKLSARQGDPLDVRAYVKSVSDGQFRFRSMWAGIASDTGLSARLQIEGIDVLVTSRRGQVLDPEVFMINGMDVRRYKVVGVKSAVHFRAGFEPIATAIIAANTDGLSSARVADFPRRRADRALHPLDSGVVYTAAGSPEPAPPGQVR